MPSLAELIRHAEEWLRSQVNVTAGLTEAVAETRLDEILGPYEALAATRKLLADRKAALAVAQRRVRQLDNTVSHLFRVLPFLEESWTQQRVLLQDAINENAENGLADWLNYWFTAASSRRLDALERLHTDVLLPPGIGVIGERLSIIVRALAESDWLTCREILLIGAVGVRVGSRQVPDRPVPNRSAPGSRGPGFEPDQSVREDLRLLAARLALHDGLLDQADAVLDTDGQKMAPRLALHARSARLRRTDGDAAASLLGQADDLEPRDLDVTVESIAQARQRGDMDGALDDARAAAGALLSLSDIDSDIGRLVDPPAELYIALAERARDEDDHDGARLLLNRAAETAAWDDNEVLSAVEEVRAGVAASAAEQRRAYLLAGQSRTNAGQLERARRNYEAAADGDTPADPEDARVQLAARLRLADIISATSQQRPYSAVADELSKALSQLLAARPQADMTGAESWGYLTENDLRIQLSKVPGRKDRYEQEWAALLAAARAVSLKPGWAGSWLALADAAVTRDLYWVAGAAAERAYETVPNEATQVGSVWALINTGRYEDALGRLGDADDPGNTDDPWTQCARGLTALRLGRADEAVGHFVGLTINPTWHWAWHSYICALVIMGDIAAARLKSAEFMRATGGREGERSWLVAGALDARLNGRLDDARELAERLSQVTGPDDMKGLRAQAETRILGNDAAGLELLARALAGDPRPTGIDVWEREDRPVLESLAALQGVELRLGSLEPILIRMRARAHANDPAAELRRAARAASGIPLADKAARLTQAVLQASLEPTDLGLAQLLDTLKDELPAEVASLRRQIALGEEPGGLAAKPYRGGSPYPEVPAPELPVMRLRLPASWFAETVGGGTDTKLRELLAWAGPRARVSEADDLEPDGYQLLVNDEVTASGYVDPALRYCPRDGLALLPERIRTDPRVVSGRDAGIPSDLLDREYDLAALLTRPAAEVIAAQYYQTARRLPVPPPRLIPLAVYALAQRSWELRGKPAGSEQADWDVAERVFHHFITEDAYFRWEKRQWPFGDSWADWFDAEREARQLSRAVVDGRLRYELALQGAYFRWENRGRPFGSPWIDWYPF